MIKTRSSNNIRLKDHVLPAGERTCIMGILNVTPDSFSDGGSYLDTAKALDRAVRMEAEGADMIDIGGESSRPGARRITAEEELGRVLPVIKAVAESVSVPVSIDTYKSEVARQCLSAGASVVNDITALRGDPKMAATAAEFDAGIILMHMRGNPEDMQDDPFYYDVMEEIRSYLEASIDIAHEAGIDPGKIMIDPGIGFGKALEHNVSIIRDLGFLADLGKPIMLGTSRKSFLGAITGKDVSGRIFGTAASCALAVLNGAAIIRVHDVDQMRDVARVADAIKGD